MFKKKEYINKILASIVVDNQGDGSNDPVTNKDPGLSILPLSGLLYEETHTNGLTISTYPVLRKSHFTFDKPLNFYFVKSGSKYLSEFKSDREVWILFKPDGTKDLAFLKELQTKLDRVEVEGRLLWDSRDATSFIREEIVLTLTGAKNI